MTVIPERRSLSACDGPDSAAVDPARRTLVGDWATRQRSEPALEAEVNGGRAGSVAWPRGTGENVRAVLSDHATAHRKAAFRFAQAGSAPGCADLGKSLLVQLPDTQVEELPETTALSDACGGVVDS